MNSSFNRAIDLSQFIEYTAWKAEQVFFSTKSSFPVDTIRLNQIVKAAFLDTLSQYNRNMGIPKGFAETVVSNNLRSLRIISDVFGPITSLDKFEEWIDANVYIPLEHEISLIVEGKAVTSVVAHPNSNIYIIGLSRV